MECNHFVLKRQFAHTSSDHKNPECNTPVKCAHCGNTDMHLVKDEVKYGDRLFSCIKNAVLLKTHIQLSFKTLP